MANRLQKIPFYWKPCEWQCVSSNENPGDYASRGLTARERQQVVVWPNGPPYLYREIDEACSEEMVYHIEENDPEVNVSKQVYVSKSSETNDILRHLEERTSWNKMERVMASILRFIKG